MPNGNKKTNKKRKKHHGLIFSIVSSTGTNACSIMHDICGDLLFIAKVLKLENLHVTASNP
jgi:hypothetical protein